jgi:hypothetical protein
MGMKASTKQSLGLYELKQHKPWSHEEYLQLLVQRIQAKYCWLQDPNQSNLENLNNVMH